MRVVIPKDQLKRHRACSGAYTSVEWSESEQALVYSEWDNTVRRLISTPKGREQIEWLISHKLVPMTQDELELAIISADQMSALIEGNHV